MRDVQGRRGVTDFLVKCDEENNPPDAVDRGEFYAEIYVSSTRTINYITLTSPQRELVSRSLKLPVNLNNIKHGANKNGSKRND